jgi:hypothetical protein
MANSGDSDKSGPYREAVTTRVTPQNYERYEDFAERESLSKSEALRQLIRSGLDQAEQEREQDNEDTDETPPRHEILFWIGVVFVAVILVGDPVWHAYPLTALIFAGSAYTYWKHTTTTEQHDS